MPNPTAKTNEREANIIIHGLEEVVDNELKVKESSDDNIQSLTKIINKLCTELGTVKENVQKRKSENVKYWK